MARPRLQYRYVELWQPTNDDLQQTLDQWSEAGWELHSTHVRDVAVSQYRLEAVYGMYWQRPLPVADDEQP